MRKLLAILPALLFLLCAYPAHATISLSHTTLGPNCGPSACASPTAFAVTTSTGNMEIVAIAMDPGVTITGCSDSKSNSYTLNATKGTDTAGNTQVCYCFSCTTGVTSNTVSHTGTGNISVAVYDCSTSSGGVLDAIAAQSSISTNPAAGSVTAAGAGIAIAAYAGIQNPTATTGSFTFNAIADNAIMNGVGAANFVNSSGGSLTATFNTGGGHWSMVVAEFKEASGGTPVRRRAAVINR